MEAAKRIEIIANEIELSKLLASLDRVGVSGYSVMRNVAGKGARGRIQNDLESTSLSNVYILVICAAEQTDPVVAAIQPILKKWGGMCVISEAQMIHFGH